MIIGRYLVKNLVSVTVFITLTLTMVIWLTQSLKLLELVANSDAPAGVFLKLVFLSLPRFLEIILPLSLVAAILFTYNKMIMDNEMIVMRACGFDQYALARPALNIAAVLTFILLALTTYVSAKGYAEMQQLRQDVKTQYTSFLLREGVFNTFGNDLTVYLGRRTESGDLLGIVIHDKRDKDKPAVTITAKKGRMVMEEGIPQIVAFEGMRQQLDEKTGSLSKLYFSRYTIEIKGFADEPFVRWKQPNERTFYELLNLDTTNKYDMRYDYMFYVEAHHRIVTPFNALAYALTALAFILLGPFNRRGQTKKVLGAAVAVIILQALNLATVSAARKNPDFLPLLYIWTFVPIFLAGYVLTYRGEVHLRHLLRRWRTRHMRAGATV